jgi:hypothetical protein
MRNQNRKTRSGLILLVVLSMLTLLSLLSITYVVFSSQARSSSMGMARKDFRGTPHTTLLDGAIRQVLRGSDSRSMTWKNSLLGDLYGSSNGLNDNFVPLFARTSTRDNPARTARLSAGQWLMTGAMPPAAGTLESVQIFGGSIVKVPLEWDAALPEQHDVWNGRVLSFTSGPLTGLSFRAIRYLGEISELAPPMNIPPTLVYDHSLQYSIMLDMSELRNRSLAPFLTSSTNAYSLFYNAAGGAYGMHLNAGPMNSYGSGLDILGNIQTADVAPAIPFLPVGLNQFPPATATEPYRDIATSILANYSYTKLANTGFIPSGDEDEPYDAPDFANYALSHVFPSSGPPSAADVIPSFHRPAVINYIYSRLMAAKPMTNSMYGPSDLFSLIELMQRACGRPLSFTIRNAQGYPVLVQQNANFTGSNPGDYPLQAIDLDVNWANWGTVEHDKVQAWVRWLQKGPWDVDNDGNGITDSVWTDINLPLMTSPEGKLLKLLAAYYIEDLGGRLDINATGNREQSAATFGSYSVDTRFAYSSATGSQLPQGNGYGPADTSLRHLFASDTEYARFIAERAGAPAGTAAPGFATYGPGVNGAAVNDAVSALHERHRHNHNSLGLPGLPMSVFGRSGVGIDLFGNPLIYDDGITNEINDDPYEAHLRTGYRDSLISFAEWERLYRANDWDRTKLPKRLERILGTSAATAINSITPISRTLNVPRFGGIVQHDRIDSNSPAPPAPAITQRVTRRVTSYPDLFEALMQAKFPKAALPANTPYPPSAMLRLPYFTEAALAQLLPLEFKMNLPLDPNRPLGNGFDDDGDGLTDEVDEVRGNSIDSDGDGDIDELDEVATTGHQRAEYPAGTALSITEQYDVRGTFYDTRFEGGPSQATPPWTTAQELLYFNGLQGRQLLARHLYCLAQLILPDGYICPNISTADWGAMSTTQQAEFRAKTLAQWAVNVVDYRDSDSAMTRFPYDVNPFTEVSPGVFWNPDGGVVWGQEQSELLMTETLAFHDLRIARKHPPADTNTWMQLRVPQGSLFMEFLCTRSPTRSDQHPGIPRGKLYNAAGALDVAAVSAPSPTGIVYPVWRVLLTDPHPAASSVHNSFGSPASRRTMQYQTASAAGLVWSDAAPPPPTPVINRVVWFNGSLTPTVANMALPGVPGMGPEKLYRYRSGGSALLGGQYLVVGPRPDTFIGQREQSGPVGTRPLHLPSLHRITLQPNWAQMWSDENAPGLWLNAGSPPTPLASGEPRPAMAGYLQNCVTMEVAADRPTAWNPMTARNELIGLNISEPTPNSYYNEPTLRLNSTDNGTDGLTGAPGFNNPAKDPDAYVDMNGNPNANSPEDPLDAVIPSLLNAFGWAMNGDRPRIESRANWSTAILQRLANPELAWNEALNPYVTVDWMPIDLTVFTGEEVQPPDGADFHFGSRQKTGVYTPYPVVADPLTDLTNLPDGDATSPPGGDTLAVRAGRTFYSYHTEESPVAVATTSTTNRPNFRFTMRMELTDDQANTADTPDFPRLGPLPIVPASPVRHVGDFVTLGYLNSRFGLRGINGESTNATYPGAPVYYEAGAAQVPLSPFFANRDFVNSYELMNVPLSSTGQMMQEFTAQAPAATEFPFRHTLDFEMKVGANAAAGITPKSASLLLELVAPRSPWVDAEKVVDPSDLYVVGTGTTAQILANRGLSIYRAPFNRYSTFLDFGRVNVNTATQANVFRGLVSSSMTPAATRNTAALPFQSDFATSLGTPLTAPTTTGANLPNKNPRLNNELPTEFAGAVKPGFAVDKACLPALESPNSLAVSLLRSDAGASTRLFSTSKLLSGVTLPHNPYVANSAVSRLVNLTTDQSHVFAVRVTIGYFEYDPATGLGAEYGLDEGKARRHRAFYVIDRSVPVAYQEGQDMNTENCILVRRIIE